MFAVLIVPLMVSAGAAVDLARVTTIRSQMQQLADGAVLAGAGNFTNVNASASTAALLAAENYLTALAKTLPGSPSVTVTGSVSTPCALSPPPATAGKLVAEVCATSVSSPNYIGSVQVAMTYNVPMTLAASVTPSVSTSVKSSAQGGVARQVVVTLGHFTSSAADLDQIYYYPAPTDASGALLTGQPLYQTVPTLDSKPILSNASGFTNPTSITLQVPYGSRPAFALSNQIGGVSAYPSNCYGMVRGSSNATKMYYSTRSTTPTPTTTQYYDYGAGSFTSCGGGNYGDSTTVVSNASYKSLASCNVQTVVYYGYTFYTTNCRNSYSYPAGNYIYPWGYSRNPLQYGNLNRDKNTDVPTGGTVDGSTNSDCTKGDVTYNWDDNGGTGDDNDFNDIVFTVNCAQTTSLNSSVRLLN